MADGRLAEAASALRAGSRAEGVRVRDRREHDAARVSALVQLAALHSQRGHWHKALSAYKEALQILPDTNTPIVGWTRHVSNQRVFTRVQVFSHEEIRHIIIRHMPIESLHSGLSGCNPSLICSHS